MQGFVLLAASRQAGRLCIRKRFVHPTTVCSSSEWGWCYIIKLGGRYLCHIVGSTHKSIQVSQWILRRRRRPPRRSCALCTRLVHRVEELAHRHTQTVQTEPAFHGEEGLLLKNVIEFTRQIFFSKHGCCCLAARGSYRIDQGPPERMGTRRICPHQLSTKFPYFDSEWIPRFSRNFKLRSH